jgi:hypothetical protein
MSFHRTDAGLSNNYLFWGVDQVVYVEGGQAPWGKGRRFQPTYVTLDASFWSAVLAADRPRRKYKVVSVGDKAKVLAYARKIAAGRIRNCIAAMDADYGHIDGHPIQHSHVIYTYGYSWESDVLEFPIMNRMYYVLCATLPINHSEILMIL